MKKYFHRLGIYFSKVKGKGHSLGGNFGRKLSRRQAFKQLSATAIAGGALANNACSASGSDSDYESLSLAWDEYFKTNYRLMTKKEKQETVERLRRIYQKNNAGKAVGDVEISTKDAIPGVLYGYAFNISKCQGYMDCVKACQEENNQDRSSNMQYIKMFEMDKGRISLDHADGVYQHDVPVQGKFYMGTQCFQCENPPCVDVCPVGATWKEKDGIIVIDYDWCVGCRYCQAACPYWARRFNWGEPKLPNDSVNPKQHYLGNRPRKKGVMEKCTFCIQRSRSGKNPACVEACPTGARIFGNLLDPSSEIRYVIENKKVFRLKEELGTEPKFWYFMD